MRKIGFNLMTSFFNFPLFRHCNTKISIPIASTQGEQGRTTRSHWPPNKTHLSAALGAYRCMIIISLLTTVLAIPISLNAEPTKSLGMWVWSNSSFSTKEARQKLVQFCLKHHITHLDVHTKISHGSNKPVLQDAEAFKELILLTGQNNITTAALRGNPKMFFSENHERTLRELQAIIAFSETLPRDTLFKGIKYDVEPYCTKEWKAGRTTLKPMMHDYLTLLREARSLLHEEASHLWLAADIPFWWDKNEFILEFEGKRKRFNEHIQDLTDFIVIMSYRRSVQKVLNCVEGERRYAQQIKKVIFPSLETVKLKQDSHVSFWGLTNEEFWNVIPQLMETAKGDPAMGGVMIHCYRSLAEKFNNDTPNKSGQTTPK
jgi:hypothetical protein